ncbi:DUF1796 family putative cysteine peptidase [Cohnella pontilimi]|uniref:DUF1796 family putative cysteine peptidase n=1 Tax=Cohnella pontilimi TaxID=2564100 RepID=UPI00145F4E1C|nr:DUF1796 family putative cysteine peptidase [Cohnella pontilimi]
MKWQNSIGAYKACISLGATCQTAYQLRRLGLRSFSGPLDWFVSDSMNGLVRLLHHRFNGFMELNQLELVGRTQECYVVKDNVNQVVSYHDFPVYIPEDRWRDAYPAFKQTLDRRVQRFMKVIREQPVLFVRTQTNSSEAQELLKALRKLAPGKFQLLIVNHHPPGRLDVAYEDWGLDGICSVKLPTGEDWRGSDPAWDLCMNGYKLYTASARLNEKRPARRR